MGELRGRGGATVWLAVLVACGAGEQASTTDGGDADATVDGDCDPGELAWEPCFDGFQCAWVPAPLDHDDPSLGCIELHVIRRPALEPPRGTLVVLWGDGPGSSGTTIAPHQREVLRLLVPDWHVVMVDLRGREAARPRIECGDDAAWDAIVALDTSPDDDPERAALHDAISGWVAECVSRTDEALLTRVGADPSARDLDLVRQSLGEERLNVIAVDTASALLVRYAARYPDRLRAVVLDSPVLPIPDGRREYQAKALAYEAALERFFEWCAATASCALHGGTTVEEVRGAYDGVVEAMEAAGVGRRGDVAILFGLQKGAFLQLAEGLAGMEAGDPSTLIDLLYYPILRRSDGSYSNTSGARMVIRHMDHPWPAGTTRADFEAIVAELAVEAPRISAILPSWYWSVGEWTRHPHEPPVAPPAVAAPRFLLLASENGVVGGVEEARALRDVLDNGSVVATVRSEGYVQLMEPCGAELGLGFLADPTASVDPEACR